VTFRFCFLALVLAVATARADSLPQQVLDEVNLARTQPAQYAQIIAAQADSLRGSEGPKAVREAIDYLQHARPLQPLTWSRGIGQAALAHTLDMGPRGGRGHSGSQGESPWKRMSRFGTFQGYAGENIAYGRYDARSIVVALIVDDGIRSRLHRRNLFNRNFNFTGIAVGPHATWGNMCVMDFAGGYREAGEEQVASRTGFRSVYSGSSFF